MKKPDDVTGFESLFADLFDFWIFVIAIFLVGGIVGVYAGYLHFKEPVIEVATFDDARQLCKKSGKSKFMLSGTIDNKKVSLHCDNKPAYNTGLRDVKKIQKIQNQEN